MIDWYEHGRKWWNVGPKCPIKTKSFGQLQPLIEVCHCEMMVWWTVMMVLLRMFMNPGSSTRQVSYPCLCRVQHGSDGVLLVAHPRAYRIYALVFIRIHRCSWLIFSPCVQDSTFILCKCCVIRKRVLLSTKNAEEQTVQWLIFFMYGLILWGRFKRLQSMRFVYKYDIYYTICVIFTIYLG